MNHSNFRAGIPYRFERLPWARRGGSGFDEIGNAQ
jgi:hypothetical protein